MLKRYEQYPISDDSKDLDEYTIGNHGNETLTKCVVADRKKKVMEELFRY